MATSNPSRGRGRGRGTTSTAPPPPSISSTSTEATATVSEEPTPLVSPVTEITASTTSPTSESSARDTGLPSSPTTLPSAAPTPIPISGRSRGRGSDKKGPPRPGPATVASTTVALVDEPEENDPYWTVTNLKRSEFRSLKRAKRPSEQGSIGTEIRVLANYFYLFDYPNHGLVYKYDIKILDRKGLELHRDNRRVLYKAWLKNYLRRNPNVDPHKIVYDNQARILSFNMQLPEIEANGLSEQIGGPNRSNKMVTFTILIQQVGAPVDLTILRNLRQILDDAEESNDRIQDLQNIQQVLSIALHEHCLSHADFVYNRTFFTPSPNNSNIWDLGDGKAMWRGFYSCLVFGKGEYRLMMNLDVKHSVFYKKQQFLEFVQEVMLQSPQGRAAYSRIRDATKVSGQDVLQWLSPQDQRYRESYEFLQKQCKGLRVKSQDSNKPIIYTIRKLASPAHTQTFELKKEKKQITVQEYFKTQYNLDLQYPDLPTLATSNGAYIPMEIVDVEPARCKKITDEQRAMICRQSAMAPNGYQAAVRQIRSNPQQQNFDQDPFVRAWNMNVDPEMIRLNARVKPMPTIVYSDQYQISPNQVQKPGVWDIPSTRFYEPNHFPDPWAVLNLSSLSNLQCKDFCDQLASMARQRGMVVPQPHYEEIDSMRFSIDQIMQRLRNIMERNNYKFLVVILPRDTIQRKHTYINLKKLCELQFGFGIVTQMLKEENAKIGTKRDPRRWDLAKLSNILLKINPKLNGTNAVFKVHDQIERFFARGHRIMYVGADLSHLVATTKTRLSAVAVVASADDIPNRYFKEIYRQERSGGVRNESIEYIIDLKAIMKSLLTKYQEYRGYPPVAIMFYRDGISQGEFDNVFEREITSIRDACMELSTAYRPAITYIVANKRHHTRFYPSDFQGNVPAGTVVDSPELSINASAYDFFLASQHGAIGTSRPTHYHILYDDNKLTPDQVQMITYALCYTYARCTRSVAIPAPVKYADLLAFRAGFYIYNSDQGSDTESTFSGRGPLAVGQEQEVEPVKITSERVILSDKLLPECPYFL